MRTVPPAGAVGDDLTAAPAASPAGGTRSAVRAGAVVLVSMVGINAANYLFQLVSARALGPDDFGALAALIAVITVFGLPFGAVQLVVARSVARELALRHTDQAAGTASRAIGLTLVIGGSAAAVGIVFAGPIAGLLQLEDGATSVILTALALPFTVLLPALLGVLQGEQRFVPYAVGPFVGSTVRIVALVALIIAGFAVDGALLATLLGAVGSAVLVAWPARHMIRVSALLRGLTGPLREALVPAIGLFGIASLMNADVVVVKGALAPSDAGVLGATATIAKLAIFVPSAIIVVLQPRVAARVARGRAAHDILGRSVLVTVVFCAVFTLLCVTAAAPLVHLLFGTDFNDAVALLGEYALFASLLSVVNVHLNYQLSKGDRRAAILVASFAVAHALALVLFHRTVETVVLVNLLVAGLLLVASEAMLGSSLAAAAREGRLSLRHARENRPSRERVGLAARRLLLAVGRGALVLATYAVVAVWVTWPLATELGSAVYGRFGDSLGTIWALWYGETEGRGFIGSDHVTTIGAPIGYTHDAAVDLTTQIVGTSGALLTSLGGEVAAYNLLILAGLALSGALMYAFARSLGAGRLVSWWAGLAFTIFPWHLERAAGSPSQTHLWGIPLVALAGLHWYRRPTAARGALLGGALLVALLTDFYIGYIAVFLGIAVVLAAAWAWVGPDGPRAALRRVGLVVLTAGWAPVLVFGALLVAQRTTGAEFVSSRTAAGPGELLTYGARPFELVVPTYANPIVGDETRDWLADRLHNSNPAETSLYVGLVTIALALVGLGVVWWNRRRLEQPVPFAWRLGLLGVVGGLILMAPSPLGVGGLSLAMPSRVIFEVAPFWRVYSRFIVLVMFALLVLAVIALRHLQGRLPRAGAAALAVAVIAASAAELSHELPVVDLPATPAGYAALARIQPGAPLADYPLDASDQAGNSDRLFWQRVHRHPLLNGAPRGSRADALRELLVSPTDPTTPRILAFAGVPLVSVNGGAVQAPGLTPVAAPAGGPSIYRVASPPAAGTALFRDAYAPEIQPDGTVRRWITGDPSRIEVWVRRPGRYVAEFTVGSYRVRRRVTLTWNGGSRSFTVPASDVRIRIPLTLDAGITPVDLTSAPPPETIPDGRSVSLFMGNWILTRAGR